MVKGQKNILNVLKKGIHEKYELLSWDGFPKYHQLQCVLSLAWDNLIKEGETIRPMTPPKLVKVTFDYAKMHNISYLVENEYSYLKRKYKGKTDGEIFDEAVTNVFQIQRHWFHYKVPKWLNVMNNLQKYVCEKNGLKPGNYTYYSNQIENDFVRENLSILVEYGIPKSAIDKLEKKLPKELDADAVLNEIKERELIETSDLIEYEKERIRENL